MATSLHRTPFYHQAKPTFSVYENWTTESSLKWMELHWHWSVYASVIYVITIFSIQRYMTDRKPFHLRALLTVWNAGLSLFSIIGSYYMVKGMSANLLPPTGSLWNSICIATSSTSAQYWLWLFILSKILELGDTLFIVLRKQQLIFLHWYHHVVTLCFCWYSTSQNISLGAWFATMNYLVHSVMYAYYAARAMKISVPRSLAMIITSLQITQMIIGLYVVSYGLWIKYTYPAGTRCETPLFTLQFAFTMYISFFILFCSFFRGAYLSSRKRPSSSSSKGQSVSNGTSNHHNHHNHQTNGFVSNGKLPSCSSSSATTNGVHKPPTLSMANNNVQHLPSTTTHPKDD